MRAGVLAAVASLGAVTAVGACGGSRAPTPAHVTPTATAATATARADASAAPDDAGAEEAVLTGDAGSADARRRAAALYREASAAYGRGELQAAARGFVEAYALFPSPELAFNAARVYERLADVDSAVRYFDLVLASNPSPAQREDIAARVASLRDYDRRRREDIAQPPPGADALSREGATWFQRGVALFRRGRFAAALQAFEAARQFAQSPELSFNLGVTHERLGHARDAIDAFRDYLSRRPDAPDREGIERRIRALEER